MAGRRIPEATAPLRNLREEGEAKSATPPPSEGEQGDFPLLRSGARTRVVTEKTKSGILLKANEPDAEIREGQGSLTRKRTLGVAISIYVSAHTGGTTLLGNPREEREANSTTPPSRGGERGDFQLLYWGIRRRVAEEGKTKCEVAISFDV